MENNIKDVSFLIRHLKRSHYDEPNTIKDDAFQLREDRCPPEEYLSFYHSKKTTESQRVLDVIKIFQSKNFNLKNNCGFAHTDVNNSISEINTTRDIIEFKEYNYPHYGMHFLTDDDMEILEAKTVLIYNSQLFKFEEFQNALELL
ncbi:hypothetical protein [Aeromonas veronii]|uniref:hypothetical protein n=1 Tax=Aeromonas veronii TaxID=654 RepID=UPI003B9F4DD7